MIQRIQTIYLAIVFILAMLMFFFPIVSIISESSAYFVLKYRSVINPDNGMVHGHNFPLAAILALNMLLALVALFLYKKRTLQLRITVFNMVLLVGSLGLIWFYASQASRALNGEIVISFPILFPVIELIVSFLAFKGIQKDDNLVRSVDRIR